MFSFSSPLWMQQYSKLFSLHLLGTQVTKPEVDTSPQQLPVRQQVKAAAAPSRPQAHKGAGVLPLRSSTKAL